MRWVIKDIRVQPNKQGTAYTTRAVWSGMDTVSSDDKIYICNASHDNFLIKDAPCTIMASGDVGTIIPLGAGGTIDAVAADAPWEQRFKACISTMLACKDCHTIIGVVDPPPAEHVYEALAALEEHEHALSTLYQHPRKMLLLTGPETVLYPDVHEEKHATDGIPGTVQHIQHIRWTNDIWTAMTDNFDWGCVVFTHGGCERLVTALSRLLGSHRICTPNLVVIPYPEGCTCPKEAMHLLQTSKNVDSSTLRCSTTRGIVVQPTDFAEVSATVVLQDNTDDAKEADEMSLLRQMLTSTQPAEVGAACFQLDSMHLQCPVMRKAVANILHDQRTKAWANIANPPPVLRRASTQAPHTACR